MAFSTTTRGQAYVGPMFRIIYGDWSGASGDAAGTMTFGGTYQGSLWWKVDASSNTSQIFPSVSASLVSPITTLTIQNQDDVVTGKFVIFCLGS